MVKKILNKQCLARVGNEWLGWPAQKKNRNLDVHFFRNGKKITFSTKSNGNFTATHKKVEEYIWDTLPVAANSVDAVRCARTTAMVRRMERR